MFYYATPEKVAIGWAGQIPTLSPSMVDDQLPFERETWSASGFVVPVLVGGGANIYFRLDQPVVTFDCFANQEDTDLPAWVKAQAIAETIRVFTYANQPVFVPLPTCDEDAKVLSTYVLRSPRKKYGDYGDYGAYSIDVQLYWVPIPR